MLLLGCLGCQWHLSPSEEDDHHAGLTIERYDRVEGLYLTMADYAALRQMKTDFPLQTRTLIENVLQLGAVNDPDINTRWLLFFQDSTLQALIGDVQRQYENVDDLNKSFTAAFARLEKMLPGLEVPRIYTQIGSFDQSIVVTDSMLGISLDKYLGADYPAYLRYGYSERQRSMMTRDYIVPDCLGFYLLSHFPMPIEADTVHHLRHWHMMKIQYVVNQAMDRRVFVNDTIAQIGQYVKEHPRLTTAELLHLPAENILHQ